MSLWLFCLLLVVGYLEIYRGFQSYLSGAEGLKQQISTLKEKLGHEELKGHLARYQLEDFRQDLATRLPEVAAKVKNHDETYHLRNLASLTQLPSEKLKIERAASMFEKGKKLFREKNYPRANKIFNKLVKAYPESIYSIEAYFF